MKNTIPNKPFEYQLFIDGEYKEAISGKRFERYSPAHNVLIGTYAEADSEDTEEAVEVASKALKGPWASMNGSERAAIILKTAQLIRDNAEELALIETLESGKPIAQANDEMEWTACNWDYAATLARHNKGESYNSLGNDMLALTVREPIGVVSMITAWNFPFLLVSQKLPMALAVGCTAVIKPSEFTSGTTLRLGALLKEAGLPDGVVNILSGYGKPVGETMTDHPKVDMISFTGSSPVGKMIASKAGAQLKKVELELGGKNPQIIFPDADLEAALDAVVHGLCFNMGECCNSGSRILIHKSIADDFVKKVVELTKTLKVGDPLDPTVKMGAIINDQQATKICDYFDTAKEEGAKVQLGGNRICDDTGCYIEPTVYTNVTANMKVAKDEIFGPVLSVLTFETEEEAINIANSTPFGLSASVWTKDIDRAMRVSRTVDAGTLWINTFLSGYAEVPFGGYKESGLGREMGTAAIDAFTELKTIQIHIGERTGWWAK